MVVRTPRHAIIHRLLAAAALLALCCVAGLVVRRLVAHPSQGPVVIYLVDALRRDRVSV